MASVTKADTITLVAATAAATTLTQKWDVVEVVNHSTDAVVYARGDGTTATVAGDNNEAILPGERLSIGVAWSTAGEGTISVISAGTPTVTVVGA